MSVKFCIIEKRAFNYPIENILEVFKLDIHKFAKESKFIDEFEDSDDDYLDIKTAPKKIKVLKKEVFLKSSLKYIVNYNKGLLHIKSRKKEDNNLNIDCKIRAFPDNENTLIAVNFSGDVDLDISRFLEPVLTAFINKEIQKFLNETLKVFEVEKN